jgi:ABC-type antimicrobial peptide transport system permease subunit
VKLPEHTNVANFNLQLREYVKKMKSADNKDSHIIQTLSDIHFDTKIGTYSGITMSHQMINALWLIAAFIILIACVNFINLSTAQAVNRAKEVGVRKVLGSNRSQLRFQFLTETFLIVVYSLVLALIIAWLGLPAINKILSLPLSFKADNFRSIGMFVVILGVAVTVVAGFYPSLVMSRFNPIYALKSKLTDRQAKGISLRRGLVVFQFVIAQALIIGTLIILKQMNFFVKQPIGFDKNAVVNIPFPDDSASISKLPYLKKQLSSINSISDISFSSNTPIEDDNDNWTTFKFNHAIKETDFYAINKWVDNDFVKTYKLPLVAGRNLDASDTVKEFLVNEALVKKLGLKSADEAVNKDVSMWDDRLNGKIVGVVKDFYNRSFRRDLAPLIMSTMNKGYEEAGIRIATTDLSNSMKNIEKVWNQVFPDYVFEYQFLDAKVANFYKQEGQLSKLYQLFSVIAIFLSCLGLYGLASFMAVQRLKEVGIRKVLGATAMNIVYLFSKEFVVLIGIALVIASPIAWYYMNKWLQDYPSRIQISWWIFLTGGMVSVFIALATVSFQAIKAALTNPVKSLRSE